MFLRSGLTSPTMMSLSLKTYRFLDFLLQQPNIAQALWYNRALTALMSWPSTNLTKELQPISSRIGGFSFKTAAISLSRTFLPLVISFMFFSAIGINRLGFMSSNGCPKISLALAPDHWSVPSPNTLSLNCL